MFQQYTLERKRRKRKYPMLIILAQIDTNLVNKIPITSKSIQIKFPLGMDHLFNADNAIYVVIHTLTQTHINKQHFYTCTHNKHYAQINANYNISYFAKFETTC